MDYQPLSEDRVLSSGGSVNRHFTDSFAENTRTTRQNHPRKNQEAKLIFMFVETKFIIGAVLVVTIMIDHCVILLVNYFIMYSCPTECESC
jgi:hypothetical protein